LLLIDVKAAINSGSIGTIVLRGGVKEVLRVAPLHILFRASGLGEHAFSRVDGGRMVV